MSTGVRKNPNLTYPLEVTEGEQSKEELGSVRRGEKALQLTHLCQRVSERERERESGWSPFAFSLFMAPFHVLLSSTFFHESVFGGKTKMNDLLNKV